ncbi:uncharacterized protein LOC121859109 isoform X2 [Homarus americanus]|uniref:uncharacterized protein LOC121859109 isoform X2 n=1 Tax=Homarus americanus TaxID=6706 RepID=UPI001C48ACE8|nr:uncharacterized protein LOC121859109 isoform X2 [Homarus americanus]
MVNYQVICDGKIAVAGDLKNTPWEANNWSMEALILQKQWPKHQPSLQPERLAVRRNDDSTWTQCSNTDHLVGGQRETSMHYTIKEWSGVNRTYIKPCWEFSLKGSSMTKTNSTGIYLLLWWIQLLKILMCLILPSIKETAINLHTKYRSTFASWLLHILERCYQSSLCRLAKMKMMKKKKVNGTG